MDRNRFTVLRGGLADSIASEKKEFVSAFVTDTRLMGVLGMYIHFSLPENPDISELHQFFYFDAEEYGFESYKSVLGDYPDKVAETENMVIGGLGGQKIEITLREAKALLAEYTAFNKLHHIPLPQKADEYGFLLKDAPLLSGPEKYILAQKTCVKLNSHYELINYFLMRVFGRDYTAADYLTDGKISTALFADLPAGTFLHNTIDRDEKDCVYRCESLVESGDRYYITVCEITACQMQITGCREISLMPITSVEASMLLARSEFVTLYEASSPEVFPLGLKAALKEHATVVRHDGGELYMIFQPTNLHVNKRQYRLNEDVAGLCFFADNGQILCAAYSLGDIIILERRLEAAAADYKSDTRQKTKLPVTATARYEFQEPVIYEFIQSGFDNFHDFVEAIKLGEE